MALVNGATYRFQNRADPNRSLNVYGNSPAYLANVCLYTNNSNDICQQWVYREVGSHAYLECKGDPDLVLDLYTGSDSVAYENNYNAHVYNDVTSTCYIEILDASDDDPDYIQIKLEDYTNKYLTANQGSNGTAAGRGVNSNGNVYFYNGGLTDLSQDWKPIRLDGGSTPDPEPDPDPSDGQELIFPVNNARINVGYKVPIYLTSPSTAGLGEHYGSDYLDVDSLGEVADSSNIIASGEGLIYQSGLDDNVGYFACIVYPDALVIENGNRVKKDITVRYWHMDSLAIPEVDDYEHPEEIHKNEPIGTMGMRGVATGVHLHVECDTDTTPMYTFWTPTHFINPDIIKNGTDSTINPGRVFQVGAGQNVGILSGDVGSWVLDEDYRYIGEYDLV